MYGESSWLQTRLNLSSRSVATDRFAAAGTDQLDGFGSFRDAEDHQKLENLSFISPFLGLCLSCAESIVHESIQLLCDEEIVLWLEVEQFASPTLAIENLWKVVSGF